MSSLECGCDLDWSDHRCLGGSRPAYCRCGAWDDCYCPSPYEQAEGYLELVDHSAGTALKLIVNGQPRYTLDLDRIESELADAIRSGDGRTVSVVSVNAFGQAKRVDLLEDERPSHPLFAAPVRKSIRRHYRKIGSLA
jgi:hypothetical protein